jgi:hypothetical protein
MTQKVHQTIKPGIWVERDTSLLLVEGDFSVALWSLPESDVYNVVKTLQTRGTILGISTDAVAANPDAVPPVVEVPGTEASFIVGHAGGAFTPEVVAELQAHLDAIGAGYDLTVGTRFTVS